MRVALYARVSGQDKRDTETQMRELRKYSKTRGFKNSFEAINRSSGSMEKREGLPKVLRSVRSRTIDGVIVLKLDRLFRSLKNLITTLEEFESLGVKLIAVRDHQVDMTTPSGRLFVQVIGALGEFERELIRERIILSLENARAKGKKLGRPKTRNDHQIQALRKKGMNYQEIEKKLKISKGAVWRALQ